MRSQRLRYGQLALLGDLYARGFSDDNGNWYEATPESFEKMMEGLSDRERRALTLRYGLDGNPPETIKAVAAADGVTTERIRQIMEKAIRKLRHPSRKRKLFGNTWSYTPMKTEPKEPKRCVSCNSAFMGKKDEAKCSHCQYWG